jgi:hypothetical protein
MIMKRKPRIIPYPQTIDPAHRVMFDEFKVEIVGMAYRNQALMGGTPGQVKQISMAPSWFSAFTRTMTRQMESGCSS